MTGNVRLRPVGTRGGCGEGWGPCACPRGIAIRLGSIVSRRGVSSNLNESRCHEDKHQAPSSTQPLSLSLQDAERFHYLIQSAKPGLQRAGCPLPGFKGCPLAFSHPLCAPPQAARKDSHSTSNLLHKTTIYMIRQYLFYRRDCNKNE